ncbi:FtsW/RodA/SpoVE family cell cycle protein, partial [Undibacterium luofuense]
RSKMMNYDELLVWVTMILMLFGMVMVYSASIALPDSPKYANYKNNHFLLRQAMFILISVVAGAFAFRIPVATWQKLAPYLFVATLILLVIVLVPGLGKGVNGAKRWISLKVL